MQLAQRRVTQPAGVARGTTARKAVVVKASTKETVAQQVAVAALASVALLAPVEAAKADIAGLTPCSESKAYQKRLKNEVKGLQKRLKQVGAISLWDPATKPPRARGAPAAQILGPGRISPENGPNTAGSDLCRRLVGAGAAIRQRLLPLLQRRQMQAPGTRMPHMWHKAGRLTPPCPQPRFCSTRRTARPRWPSRPPSSAPSRALPTMPRPACCAATTACPT